MGATDFFTTAAGESVSEAYNRAVREALQEYGNDPYNGTISTTEGYRKVSYFPMTEDAAQEYAQRHIEEANKWGPALAIPVADDKDFSFNKATFTIELNPDEVRDRWTLEDIARQRASEKWGDSVHKVEVTPKITTKVVVDTPKGKAVTRYQVSRHWGQTNTYDTRAQAVAAAKKMLADRDDATATVNITAVKVYEGADNGNAATVRKVVTSAKATVKVTLATPKGHPAIKRWAFFGLAAC